jgi:hypothetical protein
MCGVLRALADGPRGFIRSANRTTQRFCDAIERRLIGNSDESVRVQVASGKACWFSRDMLGPEFASVFDDVVAQRWEMISRKNTRSPDALDHYPLV